MMDKREGTLIICAVILVLSFVGAASAKTWYVDDDGGADFTGIQYAINDAKDEDTIIVKSGTYHENVNVNKRLTLIGEGADVVIVTAASYKGHVFKVTADYVNISGFTVMGATYDWWNAGILLSNVDHCNIHDNTASNNSDGIYLDSSRSNTLSGNIANSNTHYGIWLKDSSSNLIVNNTTNLNSWHGIDLQYSSNSTLSNNTANSNYNDGIYLYSSSNNTLSNNIANLNSWHGIDLYSSTNNTLTNNAANSNGEYGICLYHLSSSNILTNNTANLNNWYGIKLVDSSNNNTLTKNTANSNNGTGISLQDSSNNNTLMKNTANSNTRHGVYLSSSSNNNITCNWVQNNTQNGFRLCYGSTNNNINYNNILANGNYNTMTDGWEWQFYNNQSDNDDATNNWWGITDIDIINDSIYDHYDIPSYGIVYYNPYLSVLAEELCSICKEQNEVFADARVINMSKNVVPITG